MCGSERSCARPRAKIRAGKRQDRSAQRGYTLLELMYSVGLFTIGLLGLAHFQVAAIDTASRAANISMATNLATSMLENLRVTPLDELEGTQQVGYDEFGFETDGDPYFTVTWRAEPKVGYVNVVVETTWQTTFPRLSDHVHRVNMSSWVF